MNVVPMPGVGAQVEDVDLTRLTDEQVAAIERAHAEYGVVFFHDQELTPETHMGAAERFGAININRFFTPVPGFPKIAEVRKNPDQALNIGGGWHTDHSYDEIPAMGSMLYAIEVPDGRGDTLFANMYTAFEALSPGMQNTLRSLNGVHSSRHAFGNPDMPKDLKGRYHNPQLATQDAVHPVVITHPVSGREALYVNAAFTLHFEGWTPVESKPLLDYLYTHASRPEFTFRFQWRRGSVAFWDNLATWHYAVNDYAGQLRLMHRITLEGRAFHG